VRYSLERPRAYIDAVPPKTHGRNNTIENDTLSPARPFRAINIGKSDKVHLLNFIEVIESDLGLKAVRQDMPMQTGDLPATLTNAALLHALTGCRPKTDFKDGIRQTAAWHRDKM
jgi:UDP-glucuronate 4-epimerase